MKDHLTFNVAISLLIAAVLVSNVAQLEALDVADTCKIVKNASFIADPSDCQGWAYCLNGEPYYGKCGSGLLYDSATGTCNYASEVSCTSNTTTICTGKTNVFVADPFNCQNYCYCYNGVSYLESCPAGQNYNSTTTSCVWATDSKCDASSPCLLAQNGFVKDTSSCTGWLRCTNGAVVDSGNCNINLGLYYNAYTGKCDYKENVACSLSPGSTPSDAPTATASTCIAYPSQVYASDGATCRGYFYCTSTAASGATWAQCPLGSFFNVDTQQCNDPYLVSCPYNRCDGISKQFMTVPGSKCLQYYICTNYTAGTATSCPPNYPNFNEEAQACQTEAVTYPICS